MRTIGGISGLTLARKIRLTVAIVTAIGIVAMLVVLLALTSVRSELTRVVDTTEPSSAAAYELEINMFEVASAVFRYLDVGEPEARALANQNIAEFQHFLELFRQLDRRSQDLELIAELGRRFDEFARLGQALMAHRDTLQRIPTRFSSRLTMFPA